MTTVQTSALREYLLYLLRGGGAHLDFDRAVNGLPPDLRGVKPPGLPHSPGRAFELEVPFGIGHAFQSGLHKRAEKSVQVVEGVRLGGDLGSELLGLELEVSIHSGNLLKVGWLRNLPKLPFLTRDSLQARHHTALSLLALWFLSLQRQRLGEKNPQMSVPEVRALLTHLLDVRRWDEEEILRWSAWRQERNRIAKGCHSRRRRAEMAHRRSP